MNSLHLKIIAIISMLIDHIGLLIYPEIKIFRIIGRISFPIFAYLLINTYDYTNNFEKKERKLYIFGIITQIVINIFNIPTSNVIISMWLSFNILNGIEWEDKQKIIIYSIGVILITLINTLINQNISTIYEVGFILLYYKARNTLKSKEKKAYTMALINLISIVSLLNMESAIIKINYILFNIIGLWLPNKFYNGKYGNKKIHRILWYIYPLHFILLHFIGKCI